MHQIQYNLEYLNFCNPPLVSSIHTVLAFIFISVSEVISTYPPLGENFEAFLPAFKMLVCSQGIFCSLIIFFTGLKYFFFMVSSIQSYPVKTRGSVMRNADIMLARGHLKLGI